MNTNLTLRVIDVDDVELPASAQASLYTVIGEYLDWLKLFDAAVYELIQVEWLAFRQRTEKHLPPYESLALSMWTAPYWSRFVAETSWSSYGAVMQQEGRA